MKVEEDVMKLAGLVGAITGVLSLLDFDNTPGLKDALLPLKDMLDRKLIGALRPGQVIYPEQRGPSV